MHFTKRTTYSYYHKRVTVTQELVPKKITITFIKTDFLRKISLPKEISFPILHQGNALDRRLFQSVRIKKSAYLSSKIYALRPSLRKVSEAWRIFFYVSETDAGQKQEKKKK